MPRPFHLVHPAAWRGALYAGAMLLAAALMPATAQADPTKGPAEVPVADLMKTQSLPDLAVGPAEAKVTIVEYASMTCGHCKNFHTKVYPDLKKKYVDTGKVRFIFREFPLDNRAMAASMLARCTAPEKSLNMVSTLFDTQADWAFAKENAKQKLFEIAKQAGFTQESFEKCLTDQKLLDELSVIRTRATDVFGVNATPTFFINGKRLQTAPTVEEFDKVLEPLLAQG